MQVTFVELNPCMIRIHFINKKGHHTCIDDMFYGHRYGYIGNLLTQKEAFIDSDPFFLSLQLKGFNLNQLFDKCPFLSESELEYLKLKWL